MSSSVSETSSALFRPALHSSPVRWSWVTLEGPDAQDFLHRLTTIHVKALEVGEGRPGCFLTPQGKIRVYFTLWNYRPHEYAFELDAGQTGKWKEDLFSVIDQYTFGEKLTLTDATSTLEPVWIFPSAEDLKHLEFGQLASGKTVALDQGMRICHHGSADFGRPWLTVWSTPEKLTQWIQSTESLWQSILFRTLENWRVQSLRPRVDQEINDTTVPLEVGLKETISVNKGCYPGQEVIEKIISIGSPSRKLVRIEEVFGTPLLGDPIYNLAQPPQEIGQVTTVISSEQSNAPNPILGLVKKIHAKEGLPVQFLTKPSLTGKIAQVII